MRHISCTDDVFVMNRFASTLILSLGLFLLHPLPSAKACTGITLTTRDKQVVVARTIEWGGSDLQSHYVIVPRGYVQESWLPGSTGGGLRFTARYGYVGFAVNQKEFVTEGLNEKGLSAGLFYFPQYGKYPEYDATQRQHTVSDLQLVPWILGSCATVDEVREALKTVRVSSVDPRASTVHWRFTDSTGKQIVLEFEDGVPHFYDNPLGVLTNSPGLPWQLTNLNNYAHLIPGPVAEQQFGGHTLRSFGMGTGMWGLPGDVTPPSRFVRAFFYQTTAPTPATTADAVRSAFQILHNFDLPIGIEVSKDTEAPNIPSATQWTSATDIANLCIYYTTMYNPAIRGFDLRTINFATTKYRAVPLDPPTPVPFQMLTVK